MEVEPCGAPPPPQLGLGGFLFDEYQRIALEERFKFWDLIFTNPSADPRDMPPYLLFNDAELAVRTLLFGGTTPGNPSLRRSGSDDQRAQLRTLFDRYEKAEYLPDQLRRAYFLFFNMAIHWLKAMSPYLDNLIFMSNISRQYAAYRLRRAFTKTLYIWSRTQQTSPKTATATNPPFYARKYICK